MPQRPSLQKYLFDFIGFFALFFEWERVIFGMRKLLADLDLLALINKSDKEWGLTACTSFIVMQTMPIHRAFTVDMHFE